MFRDTPSVVTTLLRRANKPEIRATTGISDHPRHAEPGHPMPQEASPFGFTRRSDAARRLADLVRSDILAGKLTGALPLEFELVNRYAGTRNAVRDALSALRDQGFLSRVPGSGTFVVAERVMFSLTRTVGTIRVSEEYVPNEKAAHYEVVGLDFRPAPEVVARHLRLEVGDEVAYLETLISFGSTPLRLRSSWIPVERCRALFDGRSLLGYTPDLLGAALSATLHTDHLLIEAINADPFTAEILKTRPDAAVMVLERTMVLPDGTPVEFGFSHHRGDRTFLSSSLQTSDAR
jgi:GntR family transcriptional regulator